jgi:hypothetical protein
MIVLLSILLFSKSDCLLVLCCIYWHVLTAFTRRVQHTGGRKKTAVMVWNIQGTMDENLVAWATRKLWFVHLLTAHHDIHITTIFRWTPPIPQISTKMNCYSSHNYEQYSPTSDNCGSNIINHLILLPKNLLLKIYDLKYRTKMKPKVSQ